jgi:hypothetical protein
MNPGVGIIHVHSSYSHDGRDSLEALRDFAEARGIGFIGLTDHAEDFTADRYAEFAAGCRAVSGGRFGSSLGWNGDSRDIRTIYWGWAGRWIEPAGRVHQPDAWQCRADDVAHPSAGIVSRMKARRDRRDRGLNGNWLTRAISRSRRSSCIMMPGSLAPTSCHRGPDRRSAKRRGRRRPSWTPPPTLWRH